MKNKRLHLLPTSIAAGITLLATNLHADLITWDAGGADNNWSTFDNWSDNAAATGDDLTFNAAGALASGVTNTVDAGISIASLTYNQESTTLQHTTAIAAGQTLAVTENFLLAGSTTATTPTNVTLTGSTGALTVGGTSFQVGQLSPASGTTISSLDMSGLGSLNANLGAAGIFRLGANSSTTSGSLTTVKLAATSSITANVLGVGDRAGRGGTHTLKLGSVANIIHANTISVGSTGGRGNGNISFETVTGTLLLRAVDGIAAVTTMNMVNNGFGHSGAHTANVDFAGHSVDAKINALNMAIRTGTNGGSTSTFTFDTGTLEVGTTTMARNGSATSTATTNATINIGGGTASFGTINMANSTASATSTTNAILNLTGGTTTVTGNIVKIGGTGTTSATVTLNGGTLDMTGGNIGSAAQNVVLALQSGTLQNVAQINDGADFAKTSGGNLVLSGNNTFTGGINMSGGEVKITNSNSFGIGSKNLNVQVGAYINLDGTAGDIALSSGITMTTAGLALLNTVGNNTVHGDISIIGGSATTTATSDGGSLNLAGNVFAGIASSRNLELSGTSAGTNTVSGAILDGSGTVNLIKSGTGTWSLTNGSSAYTGTTNVNDGTLVIAGAATINSSSGVNINGGTLRYNASTTLSPTVTFSSGTVAGTNWNGSLGGLTVGTGQTISPGNSPGTAATGSQTWASGGSYLWEVNNATGTAGADPGWDLLTGTGTLDITASLGSEFNLLVTSLTLANAGGTATNFNDATGYTWLIADFDTITGFAANAFNIDTDDFTNPFTGSFGVSLGGGFLPGDDSQIYLTYTPIPEPGAALLGCLGFLALLRRRRNF